MCLLMLYFLYTHVAVLFVLKYAAKLMSMLRIFVLGMHAYFLCQVAIAYSLVTNFILL